MSDEIEARLRRADPAATGASVRPADGPDALILKRTIMDMDDEILTADGTGPRATPPPMWRRPLMLGAVGAAAAAAVVITVVAVTSGGPDSPLADGPVVTYEFGGSDGVMQSCVPIADIEPIPGADALSGTVVSVDGDLAVLEVDHWYAGGGDAQRVQVKDTPNTISLDSVDFLVGEHYLLSAVDGMVQVCGLSGLATPELEQLYNQWYG